uniref:Coluporin-8 n=1 Tax=Colubraria reticulata TaxID=604273 RepID=A0A499RLU0_9CAEN|nr:coluporin-8 [Colubraria reticulata]
MVLQFPRLKTLVIFLFVIGHRPTLVRMADITPGSTMTGNIMQELKDSGYGVTLAIFVENWTKFPLIHPFVYFEFGFGFKENTPVTIQPGTKEVFPVRKTSGLMAGTSGVASWVVYKADRRLVIMWSIPYVFHPHRNWMAVGLTPTGFTGVPWGKVWYRQMFYGYSNLDMKFTRQTTNAIHKDAQFTITASMTESYHSNFTIIFKPVRSEDLAPGLH